MHLEVHGTSADANEGRTATFDALQIGTVASDTSGVIDVLALLNEGLVIFFRRGDLCVWGQGRSQDARTGQANRQSEATGDGALRLAATAGLLSRRSGLLHCHGLRIVIHHFPLDNSNTGGLFGDSGQIYWTK